MPVHWSASGPRKGQAPSNIKPTLLTSFQSYGADLGQLRKEGHMPTNNDLHVAKLKAKAKSLLKAVKAGDLDAIQTIEPYFTPDEFKLTQAQLVVARLNRCKSWKELICKTDWNTCSFCGKSEQLVQTLIEGNCSRSPLSSKNCVFICNECVEFCAQINNEKLSNNNKSKGAARRPV